MNKRILRPIFLSLTIISAIIALIISIISLFSSLTITPFGGNFSTRTYTDYEVGSVENSKIDEFSNGSDGFLLKYSAGNIRENPYVGVLFENHTWNINRYKYVTITLDPEQSDPFSLLFADFVPGFSESSNDLTWRVYHHEIIPEEGVTKYRIELDQFITPNWWKDMYDTTFTSQSKSRLTEVRQIQFQNYAAGDKGVPLQINVSQLKFSRPPLAAAPYWILSLLLGLFTLLVRKRKSIPMPYRQLEVESRFSEEESLIVTFIGNHYERSDMTLSLVSIETGITQKQIRKVLSTAFDKSFKQYLTEIRLEEAKRILLETDRLIADISLYVGYKHATTFTRLFREQFGSSPREYRDKEKK